MKASVRLSFGLVLLLALLVPTMAFATGTPAGTVISNVAHMTFKDASGADYDTVHSNIASVVVEKKYGVQVLLTGNHKTNGDSTWSYYAVKVVNTGNTPEDYNLTLDNKYTGGGWLHAIAAESDSATWETGTPTTPLADATGTTGVIGQDQWKFFFVRVFVPDETADGTQDTTLVTATAVDSSDVKDFQHDTLDVKRVDFTSTPPSKTNDNGTPNPGSTIGYTITFTNTGSSKALNAVIRDTLPGTVTYSAPTTWTVGGSTQGGVTNSSNVVTWTIGTIPAGAVATLSFNVTVNAGVAAGTVIENHANITYLDSVGNRTKGPTHTPPTTSTVQQVGNWMLRVEVSGGSSFPTNNKSDSVEVTVAKFYRLRLTNTGNTTDTASLAQFTSLPAMSWSLFVDRDSSGTLNGADTAWGAHTGPLAAGQNLYFIAYDTAAQSTADRSLDSTSYTFTSMSISANAQGYHLTRIKAPVIVLSKAVATQSGHSRPGDTLIYTITYTNDGSGNAYNVVISDAIPANTTYLSGTVYQEVNGGGFSGPYTDGSDGDNTVASQGGGVSVNIGTIGGKIVASSTYTGKIRFKVTID